MAREYVGPDPCKGCHVLVETVEGTGLCSRCLNAERSRARAHGWEIPAELSTTSCAIPGCSGRHFGRGYCRGHYHRLSRTGSPVS